jgi:hypothetical protein
MTKQHLIITVMLVMLLMAWTGSEKYAAQAVRPPPSGTNLTGFLEARPQYGQIRRFVHNGKAYVQVIGKPTISALSLPSGPPTYIFDEAGSLVDWCRDLGDNPSFANKWGNFSNAIPMTAQERIQLGRSNPTDGKGSPEQR